jgi:hypothetical protein
MHGFPGLDFQTWESMQLSPQSEKLWVPTLAAVILSEA